MKVELRECYEKMQRECGIEVGDTVKVLRKAEDYELGWCTTWERDMDSMVGKEYEVQEVSVIFGYRLECENTDDDWYFPFFVLEIVKKKQKSEFSDFDTVIKLHKEMWDWLAEDPKNRIKFDWHRWEMNGGDIPDVQNLCFLCEYVNRRVGALNSFECEINCPGKWGDYRLIHGGNGDICQNGEFGFYENRYNFTENTLKRVYRKIRDICD